jgi:hypothetical protein
VDVSPRRQTSALNASIDCQQTVIRGSASSMTSDMTKIRGTAQAAFLAIGLFSLLVFWLYGLDLPVRRDNAVYLYAGQQLLNGEPPYISILDQKTPLTTFVTAFSLVVTSPIADDQVIGMRIAFIAMSIATTLLTFQLARKLFPHTAVAVLAPLAMLGFHGFVLQGAMGGEPKTVFLLCFVCALLFLAYKRWFWAGMFSALCVLTWQPAAIVALTALAFAGMQSKQHRVGALAWLVLGGAVPTVLLVGYFTAVGAFEEFFRSVLVLPIYQETPNQNELLLLLKSIWLGFPIASAFIVIGLLSFAAYAVMRLRTTKPWSDNAFVPAGLALLLFGAWSLIDYQGYPDFFPFLPFAALGLVALGMEVERRFGIHTTSIGASFSVVSFAFVAALSIVPLLNVALTNHLSKHSAIWRNGLEKQRSAYADVVTTANPGCAGPCRIAILGLPEIPA